MFWRMAGLSTASPMEAVLDKENFTLEELLDEDEVIQECKALNGRLINFLRERTHIEQLIRYIIEEAPEEAEKNRSFKFPFIACEIFTCEVDIILKALMEDEELMNLLFSFLEPKPSHSTLLAGYFSKVVICLLLRKTISFMQYVQAHQAIVKKLVDLIGITSIMEVLIRLLGADGHLYASYTESMKWIEETGVLELIMDKFRSSDCSIVHSNASETLCAITRFAPPGIMAKIASPSFVGRLFRHALEELRPPSVLINSLSVCISLLDPRRLTTGTAYAYNRQLTRGPTVSATMETVEGMLESLGRLLKLLDVSSSDEVLVTAYGKLQPPLGRHRLKIVEFISVLLSVGGKATEELINLGAINRILDLFFEYPYNNFLHHHVENIVVSCLVSKNSSLVEHVLHECDLVGKILNAEKHFTLPVGPNKPTVSAEGKAPPRIGNMGHLTRISNKLVQLANNSSEIRSHLQDSTEWSDWQTNFLSKRNELENVYRWACGRPTGLQDRSRDSDEDDYQERDYDVAALANNLSQAFRHGIYSNDDMDEAHGSLERDDEDVYFDDESAEVVISSLRLGDDQESGSLFTNSNWFAFENDLIASDRTTGLLASPSPYIKETGVVNDGANDVIVGEDDDLDDMATSSPQSQGTSEHSRNVTSNSKEIAANETDNPPEWVEWRETSNHEGSSLILSNGEVAVISEVTESDATQPSLSVGALAGKDAAVGQVPADTNNDKNLDSSEMSKSVDNINIKSKSITSEEIVNDAGANDVTIGHESAKEMKR
ncbi:serine/threonine-protein phosphatase 6 regulatory subunit 1-like isoform X3 [Cucurbita pepo subsp. pepo]|uniref:serine/threonine-protein phosphatase 6 regulatory subunit 1-like isoform X3 n=1 Tax=Cucurbita pepo subsp. pepo TaxID=3664 RepID=UPI000C9D3CCD|nr:serine/threonine-protein phosphatase 6 regulatory subunit 1-like isoform X3 [Cucurbita pepo subsp. pepo]